MSYDDDEYEQRPRRGWWSNLVSFSSLAVSAAAVLLGLALGLVFEIHRPGPLVEGGADTIIVVPRGVGLGAVASELERQGVVRSALVFRGASELYARGQPVLAGEYSIPSGANTRRILEMLVNGEMRLHLVTVPEGWTSAMVVKLLNASNVLTGEPVVAPPEGSILPESYSVERGADRVSTLKQMQDAHDKALADLWPRRAPGLPFRTPQEAVTLASIVEKETGLASERPRVAAVFINRMRKGMKLETDPTIIYGVCKTEPKRCADGKLVDASGANRGIRQSELAMKTGYNTYQIYGLPPTPIANPGLASLEAVLNPPATNDLFFVADGTGGHVFAATLAEHNKNVAKWRAIEKARGGG